MARVAQENKLWNSEAATSSIVELSRASEVSIYLVFKKTSFGKEEVISGLVNTEFNPRNFKRDPLPCIVQ